jgi:predicted phage terminase large subunit-like protein
MAIALPRQSDRGAGAVFKSIWFRHFQTPPERFTKIVQSWDTAFKTGTANDYSVCTTWGVTDNAFYLLHCWRDRVEFPELKKQVSMLADAWAPSEILIEDRASGQSLLQELKTATRYPVIAMKADTDKSIRANAVTGYFAAGKVFFPADAVWVADVEDELAAFPNGVHDDIVDSVTQALNYLRSDNLVFGLFEYIKAGGSEQMLAMDPPPRTAVGVEPVPGFGSAFSPAGSSKFPPVPQPQKQYWRPPVCAHCNAADTLVMTSPGMFECSACHFRTQTSWVAPSPGGMSRKDLPQRGRRGGGFPPGLFGRFGQ